MNYQNLIVAIDAVLALDISEEIFPQAVAAQASLSSDEIGVFCSD